MTEPPRARSDARLSGNPLLEAYRSAIKGPEISDGEREKLIARYAFAIPTAEALELVGSRSPHGVVEIGAGTGYWAALLQAAGSDVVAIDRAPPPSQDNRWFSGCQPWHPVVQGDERHAELYPRRSLLLVWPTRNETWAADAIVSFHASGGETLFYVGEGPGGLTGDDRYHALLGAVDRCLACAYGLLDVVCTCTVAPLWQLEATVELPHWPGRTDNLHLYVRLEGPPTTARPYGGVRGRSTRRRLFRR